jgi:hypothetical protein
MGFLPKKTKIAIEVPCKASEAEQIAKNVQTIVSKTNPYQLGLLAKAVSNPVVKSQALAKLKEIYK